MENIANEFVSRYSSENPLSKYDLYADDCISIESPQNGEREEIVGLQKIKERSEKFYSEFPEIISKSVSQPLVGDSAFSVVITFDYLKDSEKKTLKELCIFTVRSGKIVKQEFIY
jgi:hypothetical protein